MNTEITSVNREKPVQVLSGWVMLPVVLILMFGGPAVFIYSIAAGVERCWPSLSGDSLCWGY